MPTYILSSLLFLWAGCSPAWAIVLGGTIGPLVIWFLGLVGLLSTAVLTVLAWDPLTRPPRPRRPID